jgi:hypothetical protein
VRLLPCLLLAALAGAPTCGGEVARREPPTPPAELELPADVRAAIEAELALVRVAPGEAARWCALGELYEANGLPRLAEECHEAAVALDPREPRAWYHLARLRGERGELAEALAAAERAGALAPGYGPIHWRSGEWLLELGRLERSWSPRPSRPAGGGSPRWPSRGASPPRLSTHSRRSPARSPKPRTRTICAPLP